VPKVIHARPADSPGYTRITVDEPLGSTVASVVVVAHDPSVTPQAAPEPPEGADGHVFDAMDRERVARPFSNVSQTLHVHGQRDLDVLDGSAVTFPDGTVWKPAAAKK
jgi:hypothetical protein